MLSVINYAKTYNAMALMVMTAVITVIGMEIVAAVIVTMAKTTAQATEIWVIATPADKVILEMIPAASEMHVAPNLTVAATALVVVAPALAANILAVAVAASEADAKPT